MFNLEDTISEWRRQMLAAGIENPVPLEELEIHLREEIERHTKSGLNETEAFHAAVENMGQARVLQSEFKKALNSNYMKTSRTLALTAIVFFVVSYFLPAYVDESGFACFGDCWNMLLGKADAGIFTGGWFSELYESAFIISNFLFIGLAAALFVTHKRRKLSSVFSVIVFLDVLSWFVSIFVEAIISGKLYRVAEIEIGYYVWLIAYGLLVAAHLWKKPAESLGSIPLAHSVI